MRVVREEVFGPVLTVETFRTEDEAVALANDTEYGLAGGVWTARRRAAPGGSPAGCGTAPCGSTTSTPTCRRPSGAASASPASGRELGPHRSRRVPRDQARLPEPRPAPRPLVRGLTEHRTSVPAPVNRRASTTTRNVQPRQVQLRLRRRRRRHGRLRDRLPAHRGPGRHRRRHRGRPQRRRPDGGAHPAPLDRPARRRARLRLPHDRAAARQLPHPAQPRPGARRLLLAQHPDRLQAAAVRLGRVGGGRRRGLGRGRRWTRTSAGCATTSCRSTRRTGTPSPATSSPPRRTRWASRAIDGFNKKPFHEGVGFFDLAYHPENNKRSSASVAYLHPHMEPATAPTSTSCWRPGRTGWSSTGDAGDAACTYAPRTATERLIVRASAKCCCARAPWTPRGC